jgi:IS30 family transposase
MIKYTQLSYEERVIIADLWRKKKSYYAIAKWLNRKYDTIKNEIERNGEYDKVGNLKYYAKKAQKKYLDRRLWLKENTRIIEGNSEIEEKIKGLIVDNDLSPEQIAGRYDTVSHQTIYNWIYRMEDIKDKKEIVNHLRRRGKKYRKTSKLHSYESKIAPKTMIDKRPKEIDNRERLGDLEGDTVLLNGLERLYTLVCRKSRYLFVKHIPNGFADTIHKETLNIFTDNPDKIISITYDNGVEFSYHDLITLDTGIPVYFAYPYHSWERGTNENTNGLLRQYFPKGVEHGIITVDDIMEVAEKLNNRPRKCLGWLTPHEVFIEGKEIGDFQVQSLI